MLKFDLHWPPEAEIVKVFVKTKVIVKAKVIVKVKFMRLGLSWVLTLDPLLSPPFFYTTPINCRRKSPTMISPDVNVQ